MTSSPARHSWVVTTGPAAVDPAGTDSTAAPGELAPAPAPDLTVRCNRQLRGAYTGGGELMRRLVPDFAAEHGDLLARRANEVIALAPELASLVPLAPKTLTRLASRAERTRFYPVTRTLRISHGVTELLTDWVRMRHPAGIVIAFRDVDHADQTDRELLSVLLRRCDPSLIHLIVETDEAPSGELGQALADHAVRTGAPSWTEAPIPAGADLAQVFVDSDGTSRAPEVRRAYDALPADERARRHSARAAYLREHGEPGSALGAVLYHLEHGSDLSVATEAFNEAVEECFDGGFYDWTLELSLRGRLLFGDERPMRYWNLTAKVGACLSYMFRGQEGFAYFAEMRAGSIDPEIHMSSSYMMAMLYTRHLPKGQHDEYRAMEWVNTAIAIADRHPDPHRRVFVGAFMRNARALVELHRGDLPAALGLVNEAIAMTDEDLGPDEQLLHRSVLLYNRAQILAQLGDPVAALHDYDEIIRRDPDYGDYYFERAGVRRTAGRLEEALADYAEAVRLSAPFHEAHYNRADLLQELGDDEAARRDLDYAVILDPKHVDSRVNRADLLLSLGELDAARADIDAGLALDPTNANLLTARGSLLAETGDTEAALASLDAALDADPGFVAAWANRAILAYSCGRPADAIADLDRAIELADDAGLRANRAIALAEIGEHGRAVEDLDIACATDDVDPDLVYRRGESRWVLGDREGARADWRAHLAAYGGEPSPHLADIQLRDGELAAAAGSIG